MISTLDPSLCSRGISVEMTIKVDPAATMYRSPRYILDSGASSFNSRGVALYTMDNKLRADVAIKDKAFCLVVPLITDKWQDVVLTFHQDGGRRFKAICVQIENRYWLIRPLEHLASTFQAKYIMNDA